MEKIVSSARHFGCMLAAVLSVSPLASGSAVARERASPAPANSVSIASHVTEASQRFGIPERWIYAVMHTESRGRVSAVSHAGAMGLMQIMPATWASLRRRYRLGINAYDPRDNIHAGTAYLREMYDQFGAQGFLAAYNAGPGRYLDYVRKGRTLPLETRNYVAKIVPMISGETGVQLAANVQPSIPNVAKPVAVHWTQSGLFVSPNRTNNSPSSASPFAVPTPAEIEIAAPEQPVSNGLFADIPSGNRR